MTGEFVDPVCVPPVSLHPVSHFSSETIEMPYFIRDGRILLTPSTTGPAAKKGADHTITFI